MIYFNPMPETLEELKKFYRKLSLKHHPDIGGSDEIMKIINAEYTELFLLIKDICTNAEGGKYGWETNETPEQFIEMMSRFTKAQQWIDSAESDLASAEYLAQAMDRGSFQSIWRYCRQAAEKYLKALIILKLKIPPKIHDLMKLVEICEELAKINLTYIYRECERLAEYNSAAGETLKDADKIRYFVVSYLEEVLMIGKDFEMKAITAE